jgi:predicted AAA+ superfamily ATPase
MFQRTHFQKLTSRLKEPRKFIQVVIGPRQVGKTTLVRQVLQAQELPFLYQSADAVPNADTLWLEQQWQRARLQSKEAPEGFILAIDEVQKLNNWSETAKALWDEDSFQGRNIKLVLLGSSRLLIQKGLTESLAGRFETLYMSHWTLSEMQEAFGFSPEEFVWFGGYPGAAPLIGDENRWKQYVSNSLIETSISKDVLMLSRVDKPALMKRLFELGSLFSGQILSYNKMLGQLQDVGNTTTLSHYLELLDTAGLLGGIEKYAGNVIRSRASSPKFQVYNTALMSAQSPLSFSEIRQQPTEWGRWLESAVGAYLLAEAAEKGFQLYYWRERNQEVDFVLSYGKKVVGLEVKSGKKGTTAGMAAFRKKYPHAKVYLVGEAGIPWSEFLHLNPLSLF